MKKQLKIIFTVLVSPIVLVLIYFSRDIYRLTTAVWDSSLALEVKWEGAVNDKNFRDIGASVNSCLGEPLFREGLAFRSNVWFSGWSCDAVGNPDAIFSLNYQPDNKKRYFCTKDDQVTIGKVFNSKEQLYDLEFMHTWTREKQDDFCGFFSESYKSIADGHKTLVHCDAGRDRTGTYAALLIALSAEAHGVLDEKMITAIECDYRKTKSLAEEKFGRMEDFLTELTNQQKVIDFLSERCLIPHTDLSAVAKKMWASQEFSAQ
ncbi:MAG: tyrosine-protein phosphatase [Oligoflexales bacterium]|nr:tyrosine-protein phosphatase [Oligoflexales bacterium]